MWCSRRSNAPVKSSGKWNVSRISSGVLPSIIRASARDVRSTRLFIPRASAALVRSHSLRVSSLMNLSSNSFRSCCAKGCQRRQLRSTLHRRTLSERPAARWKRQYSNIKLRTSGPTCAPRCARQTSPVVASSQAPTCFGSSSGASCVLPAPSMSTSSRRMGEINATWHGAAKAQCARQAGAACLRTSRSTSSTTPSAYLTQRGGAPALAAPSPQSSTASSLPPSSRATSMRRNARGRRRGAVRTRLAQRAQQGARLTASAAALATRLHCQRSRRARLEPRTAQAQPRRGCEPLGAHDDARRERTQVPPGTGY